jgi:Carboxypeptidase regulatory-like domain
MRRRTKSKCKRGRTMKQRRTGLMAASLLAAMVMAGLTRPPVWAQTITGVVSGTVVDASGAAVPRAPVTLVNSGIGLRQSATSSASGDFVFPSHSITAGDTRGDTDPTAYVLSVAVSVAFSPDGKTLAKGPSGEAVRCENTTGTSDSQRAHGLCFFSGILA